MLVVIDANIAASALIHPEGWTAEQLDRSDVTWLAPSFLFDELEAHADTYAEKAKADTKVWDQRVSALKRKVKTIPTHDLIQVADHPLVEKAETVDPDDALYIASVVAVDASFLWTRDQALLDTFEALALRVIPQAEDR